MLCRKVVKCHYCESVNGTVKKAGALKIVHERFRAKKVAEEFATWKRTFTTAITEQKEIASLLPKAHEDLNPLKVLDLFRRISAEVIAEYSTISYTFYPLSRYRTVSYWVYSRHKGVRRSIFGSTSLSPQCASAHPCSKTAPGRVSLHLCVHTRLSLNAYTVTKTTSP